MAWDLLEERYLNKKDQVFAQLKRFMSIAPIQSESPSSILKLVDTVNECTRSFEILKQKIGFLKLYKFINCFKNSIQTVNYGGRENQKGMSCPNCQNLFCF